MLKKITKNAPKISIVIPSYNKSEYVTKTLESIILQDYDNYEVIIQDPGSTDGSLEIIKKYTYKYPRKLKLYEEKDKGQLDAINKGLKKAKGEILTYINADDVYTKDCFKNVSEAYQNNPDAFWFAGRGNVIDDKGNEIAKIVSSYKTFLLSLNSYHLLLITNYPMQPSVFLSKKAYELIGGFSGTGKFVMEYDAWLKLGRDEMPVVIPHLLSSFRIPQKSISRDSYEDTLFEDQKIVKQYTNDSLILFLHNLHNLGRKFFIKTV